MTEMVERILAARPDQIAAIDDRGTMLTYAALIERSDRLIAGIGAERRLILLEGQNSVEWLVAYVAGLRGGHAMLIAPGGNAAALAQLGDAFAPSLILGADTGFEPVLTGADPIALHPDLAVMLSTSGSTGSAKCVRLSHANLAANAASIAQYLEIGADERGVVSLPTHYSYGLSIVNSHLSAGATLLLTGRSVIEPEYWDFCAAHGATSFAGVPHSYDLLARIDLAARAPATLRYFTQAGGRLPEAHARHFAELAQAQGWRFYIMYGQTEATARMAYLPPDEALKRPGSIGRAIPGGRFTLIDDSGHEIAAADQPGELVYEGANVMMGYAAAPADLADPPGPARLSTGDLAQRDADGFFAITGRLSRFVKIFGNRIGLDDVERLLAREDIHAIATGIDEHLLIVTRDRQARDRIAAIVRTRLKLPDTHFEVRGVEEYPLLASGKIDYASLKASLARRAEPDAGDADLDASAAVAQAFIAVFGEAAHDENASFQALGGDSLNYVVVALGLEKAIGALPDDWTSLSIGALGALARTRAGSAIPPVERSLPRNLDTLRAVACMLVVLYHVVGEDARTGLRLPPTSAWHHVVDIFRDVRMPLFTAMAGFLYAAMPAAREGFGPFVARKARLLLVPFLFVTAIGLLMRGAAYGRHDDPLHVITYGYLHLWYIYALMVIFLIVGTLDIWISESWRFWLGVMLAVPIVRLFVPLPMIFAIGPAVGLLAFFAMGMLLYRRPAFLRDDRLLYGAALLALAMLAVRVLEMAGRLDPAFAVYFLAGWSMVFVAIRLFPQVKAIEALSAYSFTIYLWHPMANAFARQLLYAIGLRNIALLAAIGFAAGVLLPVALHRVVVRLPRWVSLPVIGK